MCESPQAICGETQHAKPLTLCVRGVFRPPHDELPVYLTAEVFIYFSSIIHVCICIKLLYL